MHDSHKVVSQAEWLAARKAFLDNEKALHPRPRRIERRQRRELPWVKVDKPYIFDGPGRQGDARRPVRRPQPADRLSLHARPGLGGRLPELLVPGRPFRRRRRASGAARRHAASSSRARRSPEIEAFKQRMGWRFKWVSSFGSDFNHDYHVSFTKDEMDEGKVYYNYDVGTVPGRGSAGRQRVLQRRGGPTSSTPIPLTRAGSTSWSAPTTFSTSRPRAATKTAWRSRWHGCAITTAMRTAQPWIPRHTIRRQKPRPRAAIEAGTAR